MDEQLTRNWKNTLGRNGRTGTIQASYEVLMDTLGEPYRPEDGDDKAEAIWSVTDCYGCSLQVWNYKNGPKYTNGRMRFEDISMWSMDGCQRLAMALFGDEYVSKA